MTTRETEANFVIADLSGFTALTEVHGNMHAATVVNRYSELVRRSLRDGTVLLERVGDEVLLVAEEPRPAILTALALCEAVEREPSFPLLRVGINGGPVVEQDGRYFGTPLNVTARVAGHARAGQILCTARVASLTGEIDGVVIRPIGEARFKNLSPDR